MAPNPRGVGGAAAVPGVGSLVERLARDWTAHIAPDGDESLEITLG